MGINGLALVFLLENGLDPRKLLPELFRGQPRGTGRGVGLKDIEQAIGHYGYKEFFSAVMRMMADDKLALERQSGNVGLPSDLSRKFKNDIIRYG